MGLAFFQLPGVWGALGAFIYAAPRLSACLVAARQRGGGWGVCALEFATALITGTIAAAAFAPSVARLLAPDAHDLNAVAAMIGLLANPTAPKLVETLSTIASNVVSGRLLKSIKGDEQ